LNEPRRFLDDEGAPPDVRRLLAAAAPPTAVDAARLARSRRRVATLASIPALGGGLLLLHKLALGALLGSVVGVGVEVSRRVLTTPSAPSVVVPPALRGEPHQPLPPAHVDERGAPVTMPSAVPPDGHRSASAAPPPSAAADVTRELALLEAARHALVTDPARALELLEQLARESPHGTLVIERELLVIQALARSGRLEQAKARAARFRAAHPESLYEERITRLLEQQGK